MSFAYPNELLLEWRKILTPLLATVQTDCFFGISTSALYSLTTHNLGCIVSKAVTGLLNTLTYISASMDYFALLIQLT